MILGCTRMGLFVIAGTFRCGKRGAERRARDFSVLAAGVWALADGCLTKLQPILPSVSAGRVPAASGSHGARPFFIAMVVYLSPRARAGMCVAGFLSMERDP